MFDIAALCWTKLKTSGIAPSPRHGHSAVYDETNSRVLVFGGWSQHSGGYPVYQSGEVKSMCLHTRLLEYARMCVCVVVVLR
jgi:hypothetical protein